jgi:hypothetical protein
MKSFCYNHPDTPATATCVDCGQPICAECVQMLNGQPFCRADYAINRYDEGGKTQRIPAVAEPVYSSISLALPEQQTNIERYPIARNFAYQRAAEPGANVPDTAAMLYKTEEQFAPTPANRRKASEDGLIWALIGLVCAVIAVFQFAWALNDYKGYGTMVGSLGAGALLSVVSLLAGFWTIYSRHDSARPRYIIWIGLTSIIVLAILWISAPSLIHEKDLYLQHLQDIENQQIIQKLKP